MFAVDLACKSAVILCSHNLLITIIPGIIQSAVICWRKKIIIIDNDLLKESNCSNSLILENIYCYCNNNV